MAGRSAASQSRHPAASLSLGRVSPRLRESSITSRLNASMKASLPDFIVPSRPAGVPAKPSDSASAGTSGRPQARVTNWV